MCEFLGNWFLRFFICLSIGSFWVIFVFRQLGVRIHVWVWRGLLRSWFGAIRVGSFFTFGTGGVTLTRMRVFVWTVFQRMTFRSLFYRFLLPTVYFVLKVDGLWVWGIRTLSWGSYFICPCNVKVGQRTWYLFGTDS